MKYKTALSLLLLTMIGCGSPAPRAVANRSGLWKIKGSGGMPAVLNKSDGALGQFSFPVTQSQGFVGYVESDYVGPKPSSISMVYNIQGDGVFDANWTGLNGPTNGCFTPPSITLVAQVQNDDLQGQDGRWWSGTTTLVNGNTVTISIPTDPSLWTNVEGKIGSTRINKFESTFSKLGHVGFTFGGGCNYGHGVNLDSGTSTFILQSYEVK